MDKLIPPLNERDHVQGRRDAPLELVEYGDYECPHCKAAYPVVKLLQDELRGDFCFAYRHFPLFDIHPLATPAAEAAEAAGAQGRFWQMHDLLFQNSPQLGPLNLIAFAAALDLDLDRFGDDLAAHRHLQRIQDDIDSGQKIRVHGTPTFFINGVRHKGGYDAGSLLAALQAAHQLSR